MACALCLSLASCLTSAAANPDVPWDDHGRLSVAERVARIPAPEPGWLGACPANSGLGSKPLSPLDEWGCMTAGRGAWWGACPRRADSRGAEALCFIFLPLVLELAVPGS